MKKITVKVFLGLTMLASSIANAQFTQGFESGIPAGWTVLNGGDANTWVANTFTPHSGTGSVAIVYGATAHDDYFVTPGITVTSGVSDRLSFWARSRDPLYPETVDVVLSTTTPTAGAFTTTLQAGLAPASGAAFFQYTYDLSAYAGQTVYVALHSTTTDMFVFDVDDFVNDAIPFCSEPTNVIAGNLTDSSADITWNAIAGSLNYEYVLDNSAMDPVSGTSTTSTSFNASGLDASTTYYFHVRNNCDAAGLSSWTTISFTTPAVFNGCLTAGNGQWPTATYTPTTCDGIAINTVTTVGYAGEYSVVSVTNGQTYTFRSSVATDLITISTDDGATATIYGATPLTWVSTVDGPIRFYTHLDAECGEAAVSRTRSIVCGIPSTDAVDYANIQSPTTDTTIGAGGTVTVSGQTYEAGLTDVVPNIAGQAPGIDAWVGISPVGSNTNPNTWTNWVVASHNAAYVGNNDEYQATIGATLLPGTYYYATRFRLNNGLYVYGGTNNGIWDGTTHNSGVLIVTGPANDNFADAAAITCGSTYSGNTATASLDEDSAPDGFGTDMDAPNLWYSFTGSGFEESVTLNLCNSSYDTSVLVYTGTSGNLTLVVANDDDNTCGTGLTTRSRVTFTSDGTSTYYIAVEGYNVGSVGAFNMDVTCTSVTPPAVTNQTCATSLGVNVDGVDVNSDNSFGDISAAQPTCDLFGSIQDVWFSFVAPTTGTVDVLVTNGTMTSANFNVYSGDCFVLTPVTGTCNADLTAATTESLTGLTSGLTYYVQVWSNAAEQGTFSLRLTDPNLATDNFDAANFRAYPNPVKNILNLSYNKNISDVTVFNLLGQEVMTKAVNANLSQIDMSHLANGAYMVKVTSENQVKTIKVIKQ